LLAERVAKLIKALVLEANNWDGGKGICAVEERDQLVQKWLKAIKNTVHINFIPESKESTKSKNPITAPNPEDPVEKKKAERKIMNDGLEILQILLTKEVLMMLVSSEEVDWRFWMRPCNISFESPSQKDKKFLKGVELRWGTKHARMVARVRPFSIQLLLD
jgi:hypothetical protein